MRCPVPAIERHRHRHPDIAGIGRYERPERPEGRSRHPDRDQRVHRRLTVAQVAPHGVVEGPRRPGRDRERECERHPLPAVELERGDHRQREDRGPENGCENESTSQVGESMIGVCGVVVITSGGSVANVDDRGHTVVDDRVKAVLAKQGRVDRDSSALGRVVHARGDALGAIEAPLDARGTCRAGHPGDREVDRRTVEGGGLSRHRSRPHRSPRRCARDRGRFR